MIFKYGNKKRKIFVKNLLVWFTPPHFVFNFSHHTSTGFLKLKINGKKKFVSIR